VSQSFKQPLNPGAQGLPDGAEGARKQYQVLIVDDDDTIREGLVGYLENYHEASYDLLVDSACNPAQARELLTQKAFDLMISDINMPGEDGFTLTHFVNKQFPRTKTAMITAYKVEDYVRNAKKTGVFNIIAKSAPFDFDELSTVVSNLLEPSSAFGIETYMEADSALSQVVLQSSDDIMVAFCALQAFMEAAKLPNVNDLLTAVIEAVTNAVYHVAKLPDGSLKYEKGQHIAHLEENEYVYVYFGQDLEKIGIAIVDQGGRITADEILYWLDRNISGSGLMDTHGRGVFLIHRLVDRVLINIAAGQRTEILMLSYLDPLHSRTNKPIYINQL
jgi:DNA-binding NarL/FixJ family response regulator